MAFDPTKTNAYFVGGYHRHHEMPMSLQAFAGKEDRAFYEQGWKDADLHLSENPPKTEDSSST